MFSEWFASTEEVAPPPRWAVLATLGLLAVIAGVLAFVAHRTGAPPSLASAPAENHQAAGPGACPPAVLFTDPPASLS